MITSLSKKMKDITVNLQHPISFGQLKIKCKKLTKKEKKKVKKNGVKNLSK